jgi:hypothetical protein
VRVPNHSKKCLGTMPGRPLGAQARSRASPSTWSNDGGRGGDMNNLPGNGSAQNPSHVTAII